MDELRKVCLVTGASRGIGKGIATQLAKTGATVYITGRSLAALNKVAQEIREKGGENVIPVQVDHSKDEDVQRLFEVIESEQQKLDVLVNNAYAAVGFIMDNMGKPFWELNPGQSWDITNNVGLRNNYVCSVYAARLMVKAKKGLIVNISSMGGLTYLFNVPYGVGKAGVDRMTQDTAVELRKHNVAVVTLWPGPVKTETCMEKVVDNPDFKGLTEDFKETWGKGESIDFTGKAVVHLSQDPEIMKKSGRVEYTIDLAKEYKFTEDDGTVPIDVLSIKSMLLAAKRNWVAKLVPDWATVPKTFVYLTGFKF